MPILNRFGVAPDSIASYGFFDLITNTGYQTYYALATNTSGGVVYSLSPSAIDGTSQDFKVTSSAGGTISRDFDLTFNNPLRIGGTAFVSYTHTNQSGSSSQTLTINVYHVRSGVETLIGTKTGATLTGGVQVRRETLAVELATTGFGVGDTLRLSMDMLDTLGEFSLWYDASSRYGSGTLTETTSGASIQLNLLFKIPFKTER